MRCGIRRDEIDIITINFIGGIYVMIIIQGVPGIRTREPQLMVTSIERSMVTLSLDGSQPSTKYKVRIMYRYTPRIRMECLCPTWNLKNL